MVRFRKGMEYNYERVFGKLERIVDIFYYGGLIYSTRFEMQIMDEKKEMWTEQRKQFDFLGSIPREYIGQEAKYFSAIPKDNLPDTITQTSIEIGIITPRGTGAYDVIEDPKRDPTIPRKIDGRKTGQI